MTSLCRFKNFVLIIKLIEIINADMTNVSISRMFRGKMRTNTCRIILLTSLVWLVVDVVLLMKYADFFGSVEKRAGEYDVEVRKYNYFLTVLVGHCFKTN